MCSCRPGGGRRRVIRAVDRRILDILSDHGADGTIVAPVRPSRHFDPDARRVARCTALARSGYISRAARALAQSDLPPVDEKVLDRLKDLHPAATGPAPELPDTAPSRC